MNARETPREKLPGKSTSKANDRDGLREEVGQALSDVHEA